MKKNIVKKFLACTLLGASMISFNAAHIVKAEACEECNYYSYEGWNYLGGNWYYFDIYSGIMAYDTYIDGYYLDYNGVWVY